MKSPDELTGMKEGIRNLERAIRSLQDRIVSTEDLDRKIRAIKESVTEEVANLKVNLQHEVPRLWTEVVKTTPANPPEITVEHLTRVLEKVSENEKDSEVRSRGIVVYNLTESDKASSEERKREDSEAICELLDFIGCEYAQVIHTDRLGKYTEDRIRDRKNRPVKVRFSRTEDRDKVLKSLYKLRDAPDGI
jgi:hypothetical protein